MSPVHLSARRSLSHAQSVISLEPGYAAMGEARSIPSQAREYVESLHQNQKDMLLYGTLLVLHYHMRHRRILDV